MVDIKFDGFGSGRVFKGFLFDEEVKLVYGVLILLWSMVKRLFGWCVNVSLVLCDVVDDLLFSDDEFFIFYIIF